MAVLARRTIIFLVGIILVPADHGNSFVTDHVNIEYKRTIKLIIVFLIVKEKSYIHDLL